MRFILLLPLLIFSCSSVVDSTGGDTTPKQWWGDSDGDGYGDPNKPQTLTSVYGHYANNDLDCDDNNAKIHPRAIELCNGIDDNCNGQVDEGCIPNQVYIYHHDFDLDGYGSLTDTIHSLLTVPPLGYVVDSTDCNDHNVSINPGATEICNSVDDNCNGQVDEGVIGTTFYADNDHDGYGTLSSKVKACTAPSNYVRDSTDCNDGNSAIHPGANETCNGIDDNCDGQIDEGVKITFYRDVDGDGYGRTSGGIQACTAPLGYVTNHTDCNDNNPAVNPSATEVCANGIDDNCNGQIDEDCGPSQLTITTTSIPVRKEDNGLSMLSTTFYNTVNYPKFNTVWGDSLRKRTNEGLWPGGHLQDLANYNIGDTTVVNDHWFGYHCLPSPDPQDQLSTACTIFGDTDANNMGFRLWRQKLKPAGIHVIPLLNAGNFGTHSTAEYLWVIDQFGADSGFAAIGQEIYINVGGHGDNTTIKGIIRNFSKVIDSIHKYRPAVHFIIDMENLQKIFSSTKEKYIWDSCAWYFHHGYIHVPISFLSLRTYGYVYDGGFMNRLDTSQNWKPMFDQKDSAFHVIQPKMYDTLKASYGDSATIAYLQYGSKNSNDGQNLPWYHYVYGSNWDCEQYLEQQMAWQEVQRTDPGSITACFYEGPKDFINPSGIPQQNFSPTFELITQWLDSSEFECATTSSLPSTLHLQSTLDSTTHTIHVAFANRWSSSLSITAPITVDGVTYNSLSFSIYSYYNPYWGSTSLFPNMLSNQATITIPGNSWGEFKFKIN